MTSRVGGLAAVVGGACWVVAAWFAASSPPYGTDGILENRFLVEEAWLLAALPPLAIGALALDRAQRHRVDDAASRVGAGLFVLGAVLASVSLALEGLSLVVMDRPLFEIGARVLFVPAGGLLLAWSALRARTVPVGAASILLVGAGLLFIANSENWMAGLAALFGVGWMAVGVSLTRGGSDGRSSGHRRAAPHTVGS